MKRTATALIAIFAAVAMAACTTGLKKDLVGTYDAAMRMENVDTANQMMVMMAAMVEQMEMEMDIHKDGKLDLIINRGTESESIPLTWKLLPGDSIEFLDEEQVPQVFAVQPSDSGFVLAGDYNSFILTRK